MNNKPGLGDLSPVEKTGYWSAFTACEGLLLIALGLFLYSDFQLIIGTVLLLYSILSFAWFYLKYK